MWGKLEQGRRLDKAGPAVALLSAETPDFISPLQWPPNLNPVDLGDFAAASPYRRQISDIDHLKERLIEQRRRFDENINDRAVNRWRDSVIDCVFARNDQDTSNTDCFD